MIQILPADCVHEFMNQAQRLGIEVRWTSNGMTKLNAAYHAYPGKPGQILLHERNPRPDTKTICTLLSHEMVHVLQHWRGRLRALPPLGWPQDGAPPNRKLSTQEKEAYTAEKNPTKVLNEIKKLKPFLFSD